MNPNPFCTRAATSSTAPRALLRVVAAFCFSGALAPGGAGAQSRQIKIACDGAVGSAINYQFVLADKSGTRLRLLPAPGPDGLIDLEIPDKYVQPGAAIRIVDLTHRKVARFPIQSADDRAVLGPNFVQNGDFSAKLQGWTVQSEGDAKLQAYEDPIQDAGIPGKVARFRVNAVDKEPWHAQVFQPGLNFVDSQSYTVTFRARADRDHPLQVGLEADAEDYHFLAGPTQVVATRAWQQFTLVFVPTRSIPGRGRVVVQLNGTLGTVDVADVQLRKGVGGKPPGAELVLNGRFMPSAEGWSLNAPPQGLQTEVIQSAPKGDGAPSGHLLRCTIRAESTDPYSVTLSQGGKDIKDGGFYTFSFMARSDSTRDLTLGLSTGTNYRPAGLNSTIKLTERWQRFSFPFTASSTERNNSLLTIGMGGPKGVVEVAEVSLREGLASVAPTMTLTTADFLYSDELKVPVLYRGHPVEQAIVSLAQEGTTVATVKLRPEDYGVARFGEIPLNKPLLLTVSCNAQQSPFTRLLPADGARVLTPLELPKEWVNVPAFTSTLRALSGHPILGTWEELGTGGRALRTCFTFLPDSTVLIESTPRGSTRGSTSRQANRWWIVRRGKQRVLLNGKRYTWTISEATQGKMLRLIADSGSQYTLYRN